MEASLLLEEVGEEIVAEFPGFTGWKAEDWPRNPILKASIESTNLGCCFGEEVFAGAEAEGEEEAGEGINS